jgi:hypothetical protein
MRLGIGTSNIDKTAGCEYRMLFDFHSGGTQNLWANANEKDASDKLFPWKTSFETL